MKVKSFMLLLLVAATVLTSCSKEGNEAPGGTYIYKLTGPAAPVVEVQYTPTLTDPNMTEVPDDIEYEEVVTPPWEKTVTVHQNVSGVGFSASVREGVPGAKYNMSINDKDGNILEAGDITLDAYGDGTLLLNYYR